jgi:hypothetical protein
MSAVFIIHYAGRPLRVETRCQVSADEASQFSCEADAWYAAYQAGLPAHLCDVLPLETALQKEAA